MNLDVSMIEAVNRKERLGDHDLNQEITEGEISKGMEVYTRSVAEFRALLETEQMVPAMSSCLKNHNACRADWLLACSSVGAEAFLRKVHNIDMNEIFSGRQASPEERKKIDSTVQVFESTVSFVALGLGDESIRILSERWSASVVLEEEWVSRGIGIEKIKSAANDLDDWNGLVRYCLDRPSAYEIVRAARSLSERRSKAVDAVELKFNIKES